MIINYDNYPFLMPIYFFKLNLFSIVLTIHCMIKLISFFSEEIQLKGSEKLLSIKNISTSFTLAVL